MPDTRRVGRLERGRCSWGRPALGMGLGLFCHEAKLVEALWGEAGMGADPPGGSHSEDSSGGTAWRWKE